MTACVRSERLGVDPVLPFTPPNCATAAQRKEPVEAPGRTHGERHQADHRLARRGRLERQLYEIKLTSDYGRAGLSNDCSRRLRESRTSPQPTSAALNSSPRSGRSSLSSDIQNSRGQFWMSLDSQRKARSAASRGASHKVVPAARRRQRRCGVAGRRAFQKGRICSRQCTRGGVAVALEELGRASGCRVPPSPLKH
jgi:hypothetical protein